HLQLLPWFSARAGMALQLATQPVYLSRWESTPLLLRLEGGLRADPLFSKTFRPFLELGAMGELQVGAGAYARLGLDLPLGQGRLELSAAMPVHFADTLGFVGAELRLGSRFGRLP
ncbi:MAG TPA: hypothetical protein PLA94_30140, partial [Myxococcota bacterium]|nr:hypothetical protein [Myxococcota bacterium]